MTPHEFIAKWQRANLTERSAYQQHFLDLCDLLGQPKPAAADPDGAWYTFEGEPQNWLGSLGAHLPISLTKIRLGLFVLGKSPLRARTRD